MIERKIKTDLLRNLNPGNVTILYGARRTGKTFLMNRIVESIEDKKALVLNGEDFEVMAVLSSGKQAVLKSLVANYDYLFIDEAQNIPDIGRNLKLLVDSVQNLSVFATGSASFDLRNKVGAPLTGRSRFFNLYPFSISETSENYITALQQLPINLIYGSYPQVFLEENIVEKRHILENLKNGYLLKDVLLLDNLKDSMFVMDLLKLVAFQIGNDVSYNELAKSLSTTVKTVKRYLEILEKAFIIFSLSGFSRNLRKEISKSPRFYFWDNGIRNAVISNFNSPETRSDMGKLWENYCISERIKKQRYNQSFSNFYFWRTYDQQEIDLIEELDGKIFAHEFKWGDKTAKIPSGFINSYPDSEFTVVNKLNMFDFLT
jgi:uncharacterized protein